MCIGVRLGGIMQKNEILNELRSLLNYHTPIHMYGKEQNNIYIKHEETIPFSFGGNKVRIAASYFGDLINHDCDVVITYGASSSNLCRVIANMAYRYGIKCVIISPEENYVNTPNSVMVDILEAEIIKTPLNKVSETIDCVIERYKINHNPYFIYGGGHGFLGTESYRPVMRQIVEFEKRENIFFDYIFITLATGTSMSGLIVENALTEQMRRIVGISVARTYERAHDVMNDALDLYGEDVKINKNSYVIVGDYRCNGYGTYDENVLNTIKQTFLDTSMNLDTTYTGKGFHGMKEYLREKNISGKNVLFIHTGGTPLFFRESCEFLR